MSYQTIPPGNPVCFYVWEPSTRGTDWWAREEMMTRDPKLHYGGTTGAGGEGANWKVAGRVKKLWCIEIDWGIDPKTLRGWLRMSGRERGKNRWARMTSWIYREFTVCWSSAKCFTHKLSQLVLLTEPGDSGSLQVSLKVTTVSRGRGGTWTSSDDTESKLNYDNSPFSSDNITNSDIWNEKKIFLTWKHFIWDLIPSRQPFKESQICLEKSHMCLMVMMVVTLKTEDTDNTPIGDTASRVLENSQGSRERMIQVMESG